MLHSLNFNIRERLAEYLANEISLRQFQDWFFPEVWDRDDINDQDLTDLVYGVKLRLAEYSHGDWTEAELRQWLHSILTRYLIVVQNPLVASQPQEQFGTSSTNCEIPVPVIYSGRHVGIESSMVSV